MSVASRWFERSAEPGSRLAGPALLVQRLETPLLLLGIGFLLAGPSSLVWPGLLLVFLGCLGRARVVAGSLAARSPLDVGWLMVLAGSLLGFAVSPNSA